MLKKLLLIFSFLNFASCYAAAMGEKSINIAINASSEIIQTFPEENKFKEDNTKMYTVLILEAINNYSLINDDMSGEEIIAIVKIVAEVQRIYIKVLRDTAINVAKTVAANKEKEMLILFKAYMEPLALLYFISGAITAYCLLNLHNKNKDISIPLVIDILRMPLNNL